LGVIVGFHITARGRCLGGDPPVGRGMIQRHVDHADGQIRMFQVKRAGEPCRAAAMLHEQVSLAIGTG
jgi:hypothetical protein